MTPACRCGTAGSNSIVVSVLLNAALGRWETNDMRAMIVDDEAPARSELNLA